jgi:hypothetical protein
VTTIDVRPALSLSPPPMFSRLGTPLRAVYGMVSASRAGVK